MEYVYNIYIYRLTKTNTNARSMTSICSRNMLMAKGVQYFVGAWWDLVERTAVRRKHCTDMMSHRVAIFFIRIPACSSYWKCCSQITPAYCSAASHQSLSKKTKNCWDRSPNTLLIPKPYITRKSLLILITKASQIHARRSIGHS